MTLSQRNIIITIGLTISSAMFVLFIVFFIILVRLQVSPAFINFFKDSGPGGALFLFPICCIVLYTSAAGYLLHFSFRKTKSLEIFFFILFVFSLSFDALKAYLVYLELSAQPVYIGVLITRVIAAAKLFGALCILSAGLLPFSQKAQKIGIIIGILILCVITIVTLLPVDGSAFSSWGVYTLGKSNLFLVLCGILEIIAVISFLLLYKSRSNKEYLVLGGALFFVVLGRELLFIHLGALVSVAAFFFLSLGTIIFAKRTHSVYLWL